MRWRSRPCPVSSVPSRRTDTFERGTIQTKISGLDAQFAPMPRPHCGRLCSNAPRLAAAAQISCRVGVKSGRAAGAQLPAALPEQASAARRGSWPRVADAAAPRRSIEFSRQPRAAGGRRGQHARGGGDGSPPRGVATVRAAVWKS